jgi:hypothetical protein
MKLRIGSVCFFLICIFFYVFPVFAEDIAPRSRQNEEAFHLLNADYKQGLNESNVLRIILGKTTRQEIEKYFGQTFNEMENEYFYQNIEPDGLYGLDKKIDYISALPLMFVVGFPEPEEISVDEHPEAYNDYQCLWVGFDQKFSVNKVIYRNFRNFLYLYANQDGQVIRCYTIDPPIHSAGWKQCSHQEKLLLIE